MHAHDFLTPLLPGLYLVATPIGNLGDMTLRALETLRQAAAIYAEDTRVTRKLLQHYGITTPLYVYHDQSPMRVYQQITERIRQGEAVALVSDAGTPLISDPGYRLVATLHQENLPVYSVPGACAVIAALTISGLPSHGFTFLGFTPSTTQMRRRFLAEYCRQSLSLILYEAPQRLCGLLEDLALLFPHHDLQNSLLAHLLAAHNSTDTNAQGLRGYPPALILKTAHRQGVSNYSVYTDLGYSMHYSDNSPAFPHRL